MQMISGNNSYPRSGPVPETETVLPSAEDKQHDTEVVEAVKRQEAALKIDELARRLVSVSEARESKIHELRDAIKNDTYHVTAEQIADKMLRCTLQEELA